MPKPLGNVADKNHNESDLNKTRMTETSVRHMAGNEISQFSNKM